jgi:glycine hydroxymethyltransferase
MSLRDIDSETSRIIDLEKKRQTETISLIASENHASRAVLEAQGSIFTDKYAEGYPGQRYYGGCENVDLLENLAVERAKELFHADHANVQPHAGAQANMAAYFALLEHGDTALGMKLTHGGHLTHGEKVSFSGKLFNFIGYGVNRETERIDYQELEQLALKHRPKLIVAGASAYPRIIDFERLRRIADTVDARLLIDIAHIAGLVAVGLHPSPVPYADVITSTTHKTLRGPRSGFILCRKELASTIDAAVFPEMQGGPLPHAIAAKALCFYEAMQPDFEDYQRATLKNAAVLADELQRLGLRLVSGGTDNHLILVDLTPMNITGLQAEIALEKAGIVTNRDPIPFDKRSRRVTSGIRLGTPAATTRGLGPDEMKQLAALIVRVLANIEDNGVIREVKEEVRQIGTRFPVPGVTG